MRRLGCLLAFALTASACSQGLTAVEVQSQIDASIADALASTTTTEAASTTTTTSPTSTTTMPPPDTTIPEPEFPPARENLDHGGDTWAVILAASTGSADPLLRTAVLAAEAAGYQTGPTDCDVGVVEALRLPEDAQYYSVSVYFETEEDANLARDAFAARGVGATVAVVQTFCLD